MLANVTVTITLDSASYTATVDADGVGVTISRDGVWAGEDRGLLNGGVEEAEEAYYAHAWFRSLVRRAPAPVARPDAMALKGALNELGPQLREIADKAKEPHLRANASLLLGSLYEQNGDRTAAIAFYRQSMALLPKEVEPARVLALALGADGQFVEAVALQRRVVEDDMDDLAAWLLLGELLVKAGDGAGASEAYVAYEVRRKGLIDGLTLRGEGGFVKSPEERAGCALALAPAADNGTAIALIYALKNEDDAKVREVIVETMGIQHLAGYKQTLEERQASEDDAEVREVIAWALGEIARDPLDTRPGPAPQVAAPGEGTAGEAAAPAGANATAGAVTSTR